MELQLKEVPGLEGWWGCGDPVRGGGSAEGARGTGPGWIRPLPGAPGSGQAARASPSTSYIKFGHQMCFLADNYLSGSGVFTTHPVLAVNPAGDGAGRAPGRVCSSALAEEKSPKSTQTEAGRLHQVFMAFGEPLQAAPSPRRGVIAAVINAVITVQDLPLRVRVRADGPGARSGVGACPVGCSTHGCPPSTLITEILVFGQGAFGKMLSKRKRNEEHPHGWLRTRGCPGSGAVLQDEGQPGHGLSPWHHPGAAG